MADFDDDDFDIDELLDEMDAAGTKPKGKSVAPEASVDSSADKKGGGKAVRFSDGTPAAGTSDADNNDDFISKLPRSQRNAPSASLRTMFFAENPSSSATPATAGKPPIPPSSRSKPSSASGSSSGTKDDWLGIQDGKASRSPSNSPPPTQRSRSHFPAQVNPQPKASAEHNKPNDNSSDEEAAVFKDLAGVLPQTGRRSAAAKPVPQPQLPISSQQRPSSGGNPLPQPRSRFGGGPDSTPPVSLGGGGSGLQESPKIPTKSTFSGSILDQLGKSPTTSPRGSFDLGKPVVGPPPSKNPPLPSIAALLGGTNPGQQQQSQAFPLESTSTFAQKLPHVEQFASFSLAAPSVVPEPSPPQTAPTTKKKVVKKDGVGNAISSGNSSTLQLPSHLINEEELKAMSASLKTLYTNQLEQLQVSYKEQLTFLSESNKRKEELLKDEMKAMQMEYEERLERLRNEIRQLESKETLKAQLPQEEMATISALSEQLNGSIVTLQDVLNKSRESTNEESKTVTVIQDMLKSILRENYDKSQDRLDVVEEKVCGVVKAVDESVARRFSLMNDAWRNLIGQVKQNMTDVMEATRSSNSSQSGMAAVELMKLDERIGLKLDTLMQKLDRVGGSTEQEGGVKLVTKLEETEKALLSELYKIQRLQKKTKDTTDGLTLEPMVKILESDRDEDQRKREKLNVQIKEMRRDLKRILIENENRQETNQKYNYVTETELKSISQSIRDLNSQLKFNLISGPTHPDNLTSQFNTSMQQTQAEMEMKMLRDERQAMSESMAQINVEKRKLSEEKIHLEKQKLDFEKERDQLRNLEVQLKTKLDETEEIQKKTEAVRREEIQLTTEAQVKLKDLDKEKFFLKGKLMEAEQRFLVWEQKLRQEKMDLNRERDFMEKLRDQLLCPGCLKPNEAVAGVVVHPPPPPYIPLDTTTPAAMFNRSPLSNFANEYFSSKSGVDGEDLYDAFRRKYFE